MAWEILAVADTPHQIHHDLESFFWVLVWFVTTFNPDTHEIGFIREFLQTDLKSIGENAVKEATKIMLDRNVLSKIVRDPSKPRPGRTLKIAEAYVIGFRKYFISMW